MSIAIPLFFNMMMRGDSVWGKAGWKFSAYTHLYIWGPVSFVWLITMGLKSNTALYFWSAFTRFSVFGPYVLYPLAAYLLFKPAIDNYSKTKYAAVERAILFTVYTVLTMIFQAAILPAIDAGYW